MSVLDFNDRFVPPPEKTLTKGGAPVVKRWRRMLSFDPARCPPHLAARGGCAKEVSLGRWLANQGAAWGEAIVGRPVFVRPRTWTYSPGDYVNAERLAAERHERDVGGSKPVSDNITGEKRKEPEPEDAEEAKEEPVDEGKEEPVVEETLKAPTILGCSPSKKERSVEDIYSAGPAVTGPDDGPEQKDEKEEKEDEDESMGKQSDDESMGKDQIQTTNPSGDSHPSSASTRRPATTGCCTRTEPENGSRSSCTRPRRRPTLTMFKMSSNVD